MPCTLVGQHCSDITSQVLLGATQMLAVKLFLKEDNKKDWLRFCISMLEKNSLPHDPTFIDMYNIIHIDEK